MKTIVFLLAFAGILSKSNSQELASLAVPLPVQKAFSKANPSAPAIEWKQNGSLYIASYTKDQLMKSFTYNAQGKLLETEVQVTVGQMPTAALRYINEKHPDGLIKKVSRISETGRKTVYLVSMNDLDILFDAEGKFLGEGR